MREIWVGALVAAAVAVSACGGGGAGQSFAQDASQACRDLKQDVAKHPEVSDVTRAMQHEYARLRALTPPRQERAQYARWLAHQRMAVQAWNHFAKASQAGNAEAADGAHTRSIKNMVQAAQIASRLRVKDCDRALS